MKLDPDSHLKPSHSFKVFMPKMVILTVKDLTIVYLRGKKSDDQAISALRETQECFTWLPPGFVTRLASKVNNQIM